MSASAVTTAEQLLELREPGYRHELMRGELRRMSPAGWWHGGVAGCVGGWLEQHIREHGLGLFLGAETGFLLERDPDTVRAPDAAFVCKDRVPTTPTKGFFDGPPDLAVEVLSPNDSYHGVHEKAFEWLQAGAAIVWVIDPDARRVTVYESPERVYAIDTSGTLCGGELLPQFAVPVRELFPA